MSLSVAPESVLAIPPWGVQLETHRGVLLPSGRALVRSVTRRFIPLDATVDVIINEGLRGWNIRYYLAVLQRVKDPGEDEEQFRLNVIFEVRTHAIRYRFIDEDND